MKRILILIIGLIGVAYGQSSPTSSKTRFVNGIYLGTKLDSYFNAADSNAIYWRADSALMAKYKGAARRLLFASDSSIYLTNVVRTFGAQTLGGVKTFTDALIGNSSISGVGIVSTRSAAPQTPAFFSQMLTSALNDSSVVMLGRSGTNTYNLFDFTMKQTVANQSTGSLYVNIFDNGGKKRVQEWTRDSVLIHRFLKVSANSGTYATTGASGSPLQVFTSGSTTNPLNAYFNATGTSDNVVRHRYANAGTDRWQINYGTDISFFENNAGALTERLQLTSAGVLLVNGATTDGTNIAIFNGSLKATGATLDRTASGSNYLNIKALNSSSNDIAVYYGDGTNNVYAGMMRGTAGSADAAFHINTGGAIRFTVASSGAIRATSSITATGFIVSSDLRYKNILSQDGDLYTYTLKADKTNQIHYGYVAQEVEKTLPETVTINENGYKAVNYIEVHAIKIRELEKQIEELKKRIK